MSEVRIRIERMGGPDGRRKSEGRKITERYHDQHEYFAVTILGAFHGLESVP
jgi:hypothetical protein